MKAHIIYATITGNNEDVADILSDALEDLGVNVTETEISQTDPAEFAKADICIVCPYTYDEGRLPEEGLDFFDDLKNLNLKNKVIGVAGSGDKYYKKFYNLAVDKFEKALTNVQGEKVAPSIKINLDPDENDIKTLDKYAKTLVAKTKEKNKKA